MTLDCSGREALDDLVRPFYLLEERNVPDFRNSIGARYGEFLGNGDNVGKLLEGEYFTVRGYQKGTIIFKRSDLVEKLNDMCTALSRCIAATSLIKQKSPGIYAGAFFSVIIIISEHNVTLSHQLLFISMPSFLPESVFLRVLFCRGRTAGWFFRFCFPNNVKVPSLLLPYPAFLSVSRTSASV